MLLYVLYAIFVLSCLVLILSVLLQPGKAGAGDLFTSSVSSTAFGPRGTQTLLAKISIISAAVFMLSALLISMGVGGYRSVISPGDTAPAATQPATPATPAAQQDAAPAPPTDAGAQAPPAQTDSGQANTSAGATASPAATP